MPNQVKVLALLVAIHSSAIAQFVAPLSAYQRVPGDTSGTTIHAEYAQHKAVFYDFQGERSRRNNDDSRRDRQINATNPIFRGGRVR